MAIWIVSTLSFTVLLNTMLPVHEPLGSLTPVDMLVILCGLLVHSAAAGTAMWALFVCGHDAGHGTFSTSWLVNGVAGLACHSPLLVPFYPWALTHRRHHLHHNHANQDYSFPWWYATGRNPEETPNVFYGLPFRLGLPIAGWAAYLIGAPDGSHYVPLPHQRMWKESPASEYAKGVLSTICCLAALAVIWRVVAQQSAVRFALLYGVPWLVFGFWLVTVTYLQHHSEHSRVYDDSSWGFVDAALETIDRRYGRGLDELTHRITDCHVVHHLFFTEIPHYHLAEASAALQEHLKAQGAYGLYKYEMTYDFYTRVFAYLARFGYWATLVTDQSPKPANGEAKKLN